MLFQSNVFLLIHSFALPTMVVEPIIENKCRIRSLANELRPKADIYIQQKYRRASLPHVCVCVISSSFYVFVAHIIICQVEGCGFA